MGKKSRQAPAPIYMPEAPAPVIIEMPEYQMPQMPVIQPPPAPEYIPPKDYREEELREQNEKDLKKRNALRKGRASTIATSPLGVEEEADIKKPQLLGG